MGKKTTIKLKDLEKIVKELPRKRVEKECHAWGCVTPHYDEYIEPGDIMYYVKKFLENQPS